MEATGECNLAYQDRVYVLVANCFVDWISEAYVQQAIEELHLKEVGGGEVLRLPQEVSLCSSPEFIASFSAKLQGRRWRLEGRGATGPLVPVLGYVRVSTEDQREGFGLMEQKAAILAHTEQHPTSADGAPRMVIMLGSEVASGGDESRQVYRFFVDVARAVDRAELIFARTDRANRDVKAAADLRRESFSTIFLDMAGTDMKSPQGQFMWAAKSVFDEYYRLQLAHTVKRSLQQLKERGVTKAGRILKVGIVKFHLFNSFFVCMCVCVCARSCLGFVFWQCA